MRHAAIGTFHGGLGRTVAVLHRLGVTPDALTWASLVPAAGAGLAAATGAFATAALCLLASGACDLLDGALARATNATTPYGALLDSTFDRLADAAPLVGLTVFFAPQGALVAIPCGALLAAYTISYVRARAEGLGHGLPRLWMRRADRLLILTAVLLLGDVPWPQHEPRGMLALAGTAIAGSLNLFGCIAVLRAARSALRPDPPA